MPSPGADAPTVPAPSSPPRAEAVASPPPNEHWADLAERRPGQEARAQAQALREAAPVQTLIARVIGVKTDERNWRIGADAEEKVAARLAKLGPEWKVLHAVPVGDRGSDIDHIAIGPGGVYTINTKHHPDGRIYVRDNAFKLNGRETRYIHKSRHEASRASRLLSDALGRPVPVVGVIAVMGATGGFTVKAQPTDGQVVVVTRREVAKWLTRRSPVLSEGEVAAIFEVARRDTLWTASGNVPSQTSRRR